MGGRRRPAGSAVSVRRMSDLIPRNWVPEPNGGGLQKQTLIDDIVVEDTMKGRF